MPLLTVPFDEEKLNFLQHTATKLGVSVEEVVQLGMDEFISRRRRFEQAADQVLEKNAELYRRLAQ